MSLSPYRKKGTSSFRSRSSSFSSPAAAKFMFQEVFAVDGKALVRAYSSDHFVTRDVNGRTVSAAQVRICSFVTPDKKICRSVRRHMLSEEEEWKSTKPESMNARKQLAFSSASMQTVASSTDSALMTKLRYLGNGLSRLFKISSILLIIAFLFCWIERFNECNKHWDTVGVAAKLKELVYGQETAVTKIIEALTEFNHSDKVILTFTGPTGVGKTYVSSIICDSFPWTSNKYIKFYSFNKEGNELNKILSSCGANLIIIDDIHTTEIASIAKNTEKILNSVRDFRKLLLILIFRDQRENKEMSVFENNNQQNLKTYHIPFYHLKESDVFQCFEFEMKRQRKTFSHETLIKLSRQEMKFCELSADFPGCKNVFHIVSHHPND